MDSISEIDSITEEYGVDQAATGSAQPEPVVSVRGLVKRYGGHQAVAGIDLEVRRGEIFAFLGPNGAGKTTTVEILEGFRQRTQGQVSVLGQDPATADGAWPDRVGVVLQESEPEPGLSVRECLAMYAGFYRAPRDIDETIALVGLTGKAGALGTRLSGGQRRRLDFALALIGDPEIIFLDEPTTGFDPSARRAAWEVIAGLRHLGKTIFLTTHYMDEAGYLADRIAVLSAGRIVAEGTPATLGGRDHMTGTISFTLPGHVQAHDLPPGLSPLAEPGPGGSTILHSQSPLAHLRILGDQHEVGQLRRSGDDRMLAGVADGIARYVSTDVTLVRVIIAALALFTGAGAALYLVAWLLIPAEGYDQSIAAAWIASRNREGESR